MQIAALSHPLYHVASGAQSEIRAHNPRSERVLLVVETTGTAWVWEKRPFPVSKPRAKSPKSPNV